MIKNIIDYVNSKGNFKTSNEVIENALWYHIASQLGVIRQTILFDDKILPLNYFGITIVSSSSGKSFSHEQIEKMFNIDYNFSYKIIKDSFEKNNPKPIKIHDDLELKEYLPISQNINIEGTAEGLYMVALALNESDYGSINILNEEILDVVADSNLNRMKELYDEKFNAKVIKGAINKNLNNLFSNMLVFGSPIGIKKDAKTYNKFNSQLSSGIYRRSFIYFEEPQEIVLSETKGTLNAPNIDNVKNFMKDNLKFQIPLELSNDSIDFTVLIKNELMNFVNENLDDDRYSAELGAYDKIIKLAGLHSVLAGNPTIELSSLNYAYDFYQRCRATVPMLFNTIPQHKRFYQIIKRNSDITKSEIFEKDIFDQRNFREDIEMAKELAYRNNEMLTEKGSTILKYTIEPLPKTKLDKLIVGVGTDLKREKTLNFSPYEIPFSGSDMALEKLVCTKMTDCFTTVHFNGTRNRKNVIDKQNLIAFDIDEGNSLEKFRKLFEDYTNIIYTTRNHKKEKKGRVAERFRILIPTKHIFNVNNDKHSEMLSNVAEAFDFPIFDRSTRNQDRLWFVNPEAEVYVNDGNQLFDILPYIPETILREKLTNNLAEIDLDQYERRVAGMVRWFIGATYEGNRNSNTFRFLMFLKDLGADYERIGYDTNHKLIDPLSDGEFKKILNSVKKK